MGRAQLPRMVNTGGVSLLVSLFFLFFALGLGSLAEGKTYGKDTGKIKITQLQRITLRQGQMAAGRRTEPIPQLKCIGGEAKGMYEVDVMICKNLGSDYGNDDVTWSCKADMPKEFKLGSTDVLCEGYSSPEDPYILKGSCGVEYRLMLSDYGYEKFGRNRPTFSEGGVFSGEKMVKVIAGIVFLVILGALFCGGDNRRGAGGVNGQRRGWGGGGGGPGGGGDGWEGFANDPPPPYPGTTPKTSPAGAATAAAQGWRPGFWSGAAAGALGSTLLNRATSGTERQGTRLEREERRMGGTRNSGWSFGEGGGGSGGGFGSETHTSTGFGQTRRR